MTKYDILLFTRNASVSLISILLFQIRCQTNRNKVFPYNRKVTILEARQSKYLFKKNIGAASVAIILHPGVIMLN